MKNILIVDDDPAVTNYLMVFLMQTGLFDTTVVNDSREVAGLMGQKPFDILLLDMDMPNVSGMDILNDMRSGGIDTPVVVLTGVSDVDLAVKAMKLGARPLSIVLCTRPLSTFQRSYRGTISVMVPHSNISQHAILV
jgi:DNA-binding NtrC family response regulator